MALYKHRPNAVKIFKKKPISRTKKWELTCSVIYAALRAVTCVTSIVGDAEVEANVQVGREYGTENIERGVSTWTDDYILPRSV